MKKIFLIVLTFLISISSTVAQEKLEVTLSKCVDGDTAYFILDDSEIKTRFLAIDTPESTNKKEEYGKEASDFTCNALKNAQKIEIEYDDNSDKLDKYDRHLVWIFTDGELLQDIIIKEGLAEVAYLYGDYKYTSILENSEEIAKEQKLNIWGNYEEETPNYFLIAAIIILFVLIFIFNDKYRKKINSSVKRKIKKKIKDSLK